LYRDVNLLLIDVTLFTVTIIIRYLLCSSLAINLVGSEFDDDERCSTDNDSDDSWTTQEEFTSELILR